MEIVELGVRCKNSKCKGIPSLGMITVESQEDLVTWMKSFREKKIECPICSQTFTYFRDNLLASPLKKWDSR